MSEGFEARLERELIAAARRRTARGGRPALRPRPVVATAGALAALALLAVLVLAFPTGDRSAAPPAAQPLPRQCDRAAAAGELRLTSAPVDRRLLEAFAILRRPQTAADRSICPRSLMWGTVNPAAIRYAGRDVRGDRIFLVPSAGHPDATKAWREGLRVAPSENPYRTGPMLCTAIVSRRGGSGGCQPPWLFGRGRFTGSNHGPGVSVFFGIFSDGVAEVELDFGDGSTRRVPVARNVSTFQLRGDRTPANTIVAYRLLDEEGATIVTRSGRDAAALRMMMGPGQTRP